jgi:hypothetical protein
MKGEKQIEKYVTVEVMDRNCDRAKEIIDIINKKTDGIANK